MSLPQPPQCSSGAPDVKLCRDNGRGREAAVPWTDKLNRSLPDVRIVVSGRSASAQ
jgi:hypothetical protein